MSQLENVGKLMPTKEILKESLQQHGLQISPVTRFDSTSFLDKGIDAIHGVGKLVEGFALSLDNVIGQAFEDWSSQKKSLSIADAKKTNAFAIHKLNTAGNKDKKDCTASSSEPSMALDQEEKKVSNDTPAGWGDFEVDEQFSETDCLDDDRRREKNKENRIKSGDSGSKTQEISGLCKHSPGTALQWQRKAQALQRELAAVKNSFKEYEKLRSVSNIFYCRLNFDATSISNLVL